MDKLVNICPSKPILSLNPPIRCVTNRIYKSEEEIKECLLVNAYVEEILFNGKTIELTLDNYNKDNSVEEVEIKATVPDKVVEALKETVDERINKKFNKKNKNKYNNNQQRNTEVNKSSEDTSDSKLESLDDEVVTTIDVENL